MECAHRASLRHWKNLCAWSYPAAEVCYPLSLFSGSQPEAAVNTFLMAFWFCEQVLPCHTWWALMEVWTQECLLVLLRGLFKKQLMQQSMLEESTGASPCLMPPLLHGQISVCDAGCCVFPCLWHDSCWGACFGWCVSGKANVFACVFCIWLYPQHWSWNGPGYDHSTPHNVKSVYYYFTLIAFRANNFYVGLFKH